jgi:hypothetical protein
MFYDWVIQRKEEVNAYFFNGRETKSAIWSILMNALLGFELGGGGRASERYVIPIM